MTARHAAARAGGLLVALVLASLAVAACGGAAQDPDGSRDPGGGGRLAVVATTTVLGDLAAQVAGDRATVVSVVPPGGEVHTFDPTPADLEAIGRADLIVTNGLGLDDWLADLAEDAGTGARIVALGEDLDEVTYLAGGGSADPDHPDESVNPHVWLNVAYARRYVARIETALAAVDPAGAEAYAAAAAAYEERLAELHDEAQAAIGAIPADRRRVVAFHEAFPYFADAYGLTIVGTIVSAPGQDPSAGEVADLVAAIRSERVTAIFSEAQFSDELVRTLADETGVPVVSDLYTDTLGDPPVDTYEGMIRWDVERVVAALSG